jgi:hypothetical protein
VNGRIIRTAGVALAVLALSAAVALAAATAKFSLTNPVAGQATKIVLDVKGDTAATNKVPHSIALKAARGIKVDPVAVAKLCTKAQADSNACPPESRIGGGNAAIEASGPGLPLGGGQYTATADLYLAKPQQHGDIAGVVARFSYGGLSLSAIGRVFRLASGPFGVETLFNDLDKTGVPAGYSVKLKSVHLTYGAHRTVKKKRKHKKPKKVTHYLIRNPSTCPGTWPWQVTVTYPSGSPTVINGSVTCRSH